MSELHPDFIARFRNDPAAPRVLDFVARYIEVAFGVDSDLVGTKVGVTVHPGGDFRCLTRVNAGTIMLLDLTRVDGAIVPKVAVATDDTGRYGSLRDRHGAAELKSFRARVENALLVFPSLTRAYDFLDDPDTTPLARTLADAVSGSPVRATYHNSLVGPLLAPLLAASGR